MFERGDASISQIATHPGQAANESPLARVLVDSTRARIEFPDDPLRRVCLWSDANAPFYGTYDKSQHAAQRNGLRMTVRFHTTYDAKIGYRFLRRTSYGIG